MAAAAQQTTPSTDTDFIRFPPFPLVPSGVDIIPFKDYKETGIKLFCPKGDGIEVDGHDIPTVELEKKHTTDKCKTDALRNEEDKEDKPIVAKKRKTKASAVNAAPRKWWEIWQEEEAGKSAGPYNLFVFSIICLDHCR